MTCKEKLMRDYPSTYADLMKKKCPSSFGYVKNIDRCYQNDYRYYCEKCWEKEIED